MATTFLLIATVCALLVLATHSFVPLLVAAGAVVIAWAAVVGLGSFKRWPGGA